MPKPMNKEEFRAQLAEEFTHVLEEKGLEWRKEWQGVGGGAPYNAITKYNYKGCNALWLSLVSMSKGYTDPRWMTMRQIADEGNKYHPGEKWHLKKGSKATYVEYWYPYDSIEKKALTWDQYKAELNNGRNEKEFSYVTRYIPVFNATNVEGIRELTIQKNESVLQDELIDKLSEEMEVEIFNDGGDRAYYSPVQDRIHLPTKESFENEYAYNSTVLHELSHSTGHPERLNRPQGAFFGTEQYAYEELVAEMCSCFMAPDLQVQPTKEHLDNHKAYVQSWIEAIKEKPETLVRAIKDAQLAANFMDYKAGIISKEEFDKAVGSTLEHKQKEKELER